MSWAGSFLLMSLLLFLDPFNMRCEASSNYSLPKLCALEPDGSKCKDRRTPFESLGPCGSLIDHISTERHTGVLPLVIFFRRDFRAILDAIPPDLRNSRLAWFLPPTRKQYGNKH